MNFSRQLPKSFYDLRDRSQKQSVDNFVYSFSKAGFLCLHKDRLIIQLFQFQIIKVEQLIIMAFCLIFAQCGYKICLSFITLVYRQGFAASFTHSRPLFSVKLGAFSFR